jgi:hypothetical protein
MRPMTMSDGPRGDDRHRRAPPLCELTLEDMGVLVEMLVGTVKA